MKVRICTACKQAKPETNQFFGPHKESRGGIDSQCRVCKRKYSRMWYRKNPEQARKSQRNWFENNRTKALENVRNWARKVRWEVLCAYGGKSPKCSCCRESAIQFLVIDHINGGGSKEGKKRGAGARFYSWLRKNKFPPGYRVLCHNCNASLSLYKMCPHTIVVNQ